MDEQQLAECARADAEEMVRLAVGTLVYLRSGDVVRRNVEPLCGELVPLKELGRELFETSSGWRWRRPLGQMALRPHLFEVTGIEPGHPLDCGSTAGPGFWGARYTLVCVEKDVHTPLSPVPGSRLVRLDDVPASEPVSSTG